MSAIYLRGGLPRKISGSAEVTQWDEFPVCGGQANAVIVRNTGSTNPLFVAFGREMKDANEGWEVAKSSETVLLPAEFGSIWVKSTGGATTFEALVFVRRG